MSRNKPGTKGSQGTDESQGIGRVPGDREGPGDRDVSKGPGVPGGFRGPRCVSGEPRGLREAGNGGPS